MDQDETCKEVGLGPGHIVLDGDPAPPPPKGHSPQFLSHICCGQIAAWSEGRPQPRRLCVRWGPRSPSPKRARAPLPKLLAHVYCDQTAGWFKMALGMEVGLSPGNTVFDGDPAPSPKRCGAPNFQPISIVDKRLAASRRRFVWRLASAQGLCVRWEATPPPQKGHSPCQKIFGLFIMAKRLDGSRRYLAWR